MATSFSGIFTISSFTHGARRAGKPIRSAAPSPMRRPFRRCPRCVHLGPARRSTCANFRPPSRFQALQSCCANAIRRVISTTSIRSRSPNWRSFSTRRPAYCRSGAAGRILVLKSPTAQGRIRRRAAPTSWNCTWRSRIARGLRADFTTTMRAATHWWRSALQPSSSRRSPLRQSLPWTHPVRRKS